MTARHALRPVSLDIQALIDAARSRHGDFEVHPSDLEGFRILAQEARVATARGHAYAAAAQDWLTVSIETLARLQSRPPTAS